MSTIARGKASAHAWGMLSVRAVRLRNACLNRIAHQRGLPLPEPHDLAGIGADVGLAEAVAHWERALRERVAGPVEAIEQPVRWWLKAAMVAALLLLQLLFWTTDLHAL